MMIPQTQYRSITHRRRGPQALTSAALWGRLPNEFMSTRPSTVPMSATGQQHQSGDVRSTSALPPSALFRLAWVRKPKERIAALSPSTR